MQRFSLRSALVLAVIVLLAGATTSFAQFKTGTGAGANASVTFTAAASNPQVRDLGITEPIGDINVGDSCASGVGGNCTLAVTGLGTAAANTAATAPNAATATLSFTFAGNITNAQTSPTTGSGKVTASAAPIPTFTLGSTGISVTFAGINAVIGTCAAANCQTQNATSPTGSVVIGWNISGATLNITFTAYSGTDAAGTAPTGAATNLGAGDTAIQFTAATLITIHGVRVNVSNIAAGNTVQAFINTQPSNVVFLTNTFNPLNVATVAPTVDVTSSNSTKLRRADNGSSTISLTNCTIANVSSTSFPIANPANNAGFGVRITEGFVGAFTTAAQETTKSGTEVTNGQNHDRLQWVLLTGADRCAGPGFRCLHGFWCARWWRCGTAGSDAGSWC